MKRILYLPVETIVREFDARMLLAHMAVNRGYSVVLGEKSSVYKAAEILKNGIYFHKSHGSQYFPVNKRSDNKEFKFVSLDEEGLVFINDDNYIRDSRPFDLEHLDVIFTWGTYQRNLLIKANPGLEHRTLAIGNPRFDLLREEFSSLYKKESERLIKIWGAYILINTRFVAGNFSPLYGCNYLDYRSHQFQTIIGRDLSEDEKDFFSREESYYKKLFKQYLEMLESASSKFPGINFILRPHPSEDILSWKEAIKGLPNVFVLFDGSVIDWIYGALAVIHSGCTTGIEAWLLKKPVIAYNPNNEEDIEPPLPNKFGLRVKNIENLCSTLEEIISGKLIFEESNEQFKIASLYIESISGDYSVTRFLDALDNIYNIDNFNLEPINKSDYLQLSNIETIKRAFKVRILKFLSKYQPVIRKLAGKKITDYIFGLFRKYPGLFAQFKKFPKLAKKDIKYRLAVYDNVFYKKTLNDYFIKKIATDTYLIGKKQRFNIS